MEAPDYPPDSSTSLVVPFSCLVRAGHAAAVAFYFMWYNFARIHQTFRVTPAMEVSVADHVWSAAGIAALAN